MRDLQRGVIPNVTQDANRQRIISGLFQPHSASMLVDPDRLYCLECEVEFDPRTGMHALCETTHIALPSPALKSVSAATYKAQDVRKYSCGFATLDRVFGVRAGVGKAEFCGLQPGQVVIIGGPKGTGKTTVLSMVIRELSRIHGMRVLYSSGEEDVGQLTDAMRRIGLREDDTNVRVIYTQDMYELARDVSAFRPHVLVVDSLQTVIVDRGRAMGQPSQVNKATEILTAHAKATGCIVILVNQLNHDGSLAGSERSLHHVDTILGIERDAQQWTHIHNRAKNRMGPTGEVATFEMTSRGLAEVLDPGAVLTMALIGEPGVVAFPCASLARPVLVPVEAVVSDKREDGGADRQALGIPASKFKHVLTLIREHGFVDLSGRDVRVKVSQFAGVNMADPEMIDNSIDLPLMVAIVSAAANIIPPKMGFFGELSLKGKVMPSIRADARLDAAHKAGLDNVVCGGMCTFVEADREGVPRINHARDVALWLMAHGEKVAHTVHGQPTSKTDDTHRALDAELDAT